MYSLVRHVGADPEHGPQYLRSQHSMVDLCGLDGNDPTNQNHFETTGFTSHQPRRACSDSLHVRLAKASIQYQYLSGNDNQCEAAVPAPVSYNWGQISRSTAYKTEGGCLAFGDPTFFSLAV